MGLYLTDDKSCIPDVQYYLCVELYRNAWEKEGVCAYGGDLLGEERCGVYKLGDAGGGHQCTAAKLMPFFSSAQAQKCSEWRLTGREGYGR